MAISRHFIRSFASETRLLELVTRLRNETSLSISMCRKAVMESKFDYGRALNALAQMSKDAAMGRPLATAPAKEGIVGMMGSSGRMCLVEVRVV